ncbi:hypothetical protein AMTRI_Chr09g20120 [Amborella trichopoda]
MAVPNPYSGSSTLALVARVSAFTLGLVYGSIKLSYLKMKSCERTLQHIWMKCQGSIGSY